MKNDFQAAILVRFGTLLTSIGQSVSHFATAVSLAGAAAGGLAGAAADADSSWQPLVGWEEQ